MEELRDLGVEVHEDDSAAAARAASGNLIARVPGRSDAWVSFFAHMDTVPHDGPVEVVEEEGVFRSRGETILGADNKAAVTVLMELAARHAAEPAAAGLELVFTPAEEDGLRGAKEVDVSQLRAPFGFVLDHATPIGEVIVAAPTHKHVTATFTGTEAHAGIRPEDGSSAIEAGAAAVAAMELGRLDDETTANLGVIEGGTASNVVAGSCSLVGEARSIDGERAAAVIGAMVDACTWAAGRATATSTSRSPRSSAATGSTPTRPPCGWGPRRCAVAGTSPRRSRAEVGSDANALLANGYEALLLANGTEANHTPEESVTASAMVEMLAVCEAAIELAGEAPAQ